MKMTRNHKNLPSRIHLKSISTIEILVEEWAEIKIETIEEENPFVLDLLLLAVVDLVVHGHFLDHDRRLIHLDPVAVVDHRTTA